MAKHLRESGSARKRQGRKARSTSSRQQPYTQARSQQQQNARAPMRQQSHAQAASRGQANGQAAYSQPGTRLAVRPQQGSQMQVIDVDDPRLVTRYDSHMPYGMPAAYRVGYNAAMPNREFTWGDKINQRGGIYSFLRGLLLFLAWVFRIAALSVAAIVILNGLSLPVFRSTLAQVTDTIISFVPWPNIGRFTVDTPFGGVFRGDLSLIMLLLFTMDWLLCRSRAALR